MQEENNIGEDTFKNILIAFILFSLFGFLILTTVTQSGTTYGKNMTEVTGGALDLNNFNQPISSFNQTAYNFQYRFEHQSIWSALVGVVVEGFFNILKDMVNLVVFPFALLQGVLIGVFHIPAIVTSVIWGVLIIVIIFGIWRLIKWGA